MFKFISMYGKAKGLFGTKGYFGENCSLQYMRSVVIIDTYHASFPNAENAFLWSPQVRTAGSNTLFSGLTEISDNALSGAATNGLNGIVMVKLV